ncbi:MAG: RNA polymerase sigma factor [Acidobacteria bacterium]|nr:MAG: RNA polymerase sigma factor [Acidobacteriota bacterium]
MSPETVVPHQQRDVLSDEEVVTRVLAGDAALFEVIMRRHNQRLYRTVRAILGGDDEAEDAMQDAYIQAYRHLGQFEGRSSLATWLTRIAVNQCLSRLRKQRHIYPIDTELEKKMIENIDDARPGPEKQMLNREVRRVLELAIEQMPARYRSVLILRDVEGLSTAEAAEALGMSVEAVKVNLHRARTYLRKALKQKGGETLSDLFAFEDPRCNRIVANVMAIINTL